MGGHSRHVAAAAAAAVDVVATHPIYDPLDARHGVGVGVVVGGGGGGVPPFYLSPSVEYLWVAKCVGRCCNRRTKRLLLYTALCVVGG